jgi:hypothetical protein
LRFSRLLSSLLLAAGAASLLASGAARAGDPIIAPGQQAAQQAQSAQQGQAAPSASASAPAPSGSASAGAPPAGSAAPSAPPAAFPVHEWEMEPIDVSVPGQRPGLREEQHIGEYRQPRWTAKRRFLNTRVYVVPAGKMEFEWWFRWTAPFENGLKERELRTQWEFELGLGHRLQLDLYLVGQQVGQNQFAITREKAELRWALANWGELWGNPTLYLEYQHQSAEPDSNGKQDPKPDTLEAKLLLGGELAPRWHAGFNLQWERELWGTEADEFAVTGGISYTVVDEVFHAGFEGYAELVDEKGSYGNFKEQSYFFGPSFMWSPVRPANILIAPLFGALVEDGKARGGFQTWIVTGWAF